MVRKKAHWEIWSSLKSPQFLFFYPSRLFDDLDSIKKEFLVYSHSLSQGDLSFDDFLVLDRSIVARHAQLDKLKGLISHLPSLDFNQRVDLQAFIRQILQKNLVQMLRKVEKKDVLNSYLVCKEVIENIDELRQKLMHSKINS